MHPFYISADFESTLTPVNEINSNTTKYQRHDPNSYGLKFNCIFLSLSISLSVSINTILVESI